MNDNTANLQQQLFEQPTDVITMLCFDYFSNVYQWLKPDTSKSALVRRLIREAERNEGLDALHAAVSPTAKAFETSPPATETPSASQQSSSSATQSQQPNTAQSSPEPTAGSVDFDIVQVQFHEHHFPMSAVQERAVAQTIASLCQVVREQVQVVGKQIEGSWVGVTLPQSTASDLVTRFKQGQDLDFLAEWTRQGVTKITQLTIPPLMDGTALTADYLNIIRQLYLGLDRVLIEKAIPGGYGGALVLLAQPLNQQGQSLARQIIKLGSGHSLMSEYRNARRVEAFIPLIAAKLGDYIEWGEACGLSYTFIGDGHLGKTQTLEGYYQDANASTEAVVQTLERLLGKELGERWYRNSKPHTVPIMEEYGLNLTEYVRLQLRPTAADDVWLEARPISDDHSVHYQPLTIETIVTTHHTLEPQTLVQMTGLEVSKVWSNGVLKLQHPQQPGIFIKVEGLGDGTFSVGDQVGVRGAVMFNRQDRWAEVTRLAFAGIPEFHFDPTAEQLPWSSQGTTTTRYPNPFHLAAKVLRQTLRAQKSMVHGDLHVRNVMVDEQGHGWLIDFALAAERHNLFDFIKLETYIRQMLLADQSYDFTFGQYLQFEEALLADTLGEHPDVPANKFLQRAYQVIQAIRKIAARYMEQPPNWLKNYLPSLFLYNLAMLEYPDSHGKAAMRMAFAAAAVVGRAMEHQDTAQNTANDASVTQLLGMLRQAIEKEASEAEQKGALRYLTRLEEAVSEDDPDIGLMESAVNWFQRRLPQFVKQVGAIIHHPDTMRAVQALGDQELAEFKRRFDHLKGG